jgi:hypothetical protein
LHCHVAGFSITNRATKPTKLCPKNVIALLIALIVSLAAAHASVPIIVSGGAGRRAAMNLSNKAEKQL